MSEDLFLKIIDREIPADIVFETDDVLAFSDINPQAPLHVLIIPKSRIRTINDIEAGDEEAMLGVAERLEGQLTATVHATEEDREMFAKLIAVLERKAGRLVDNGYPTGVEVCHGMVHGGPVPATSDGRSTSVGPRAITRFTRLVCWQDFPDDLLPGELQEGNPLGISRIMDGTRS